MSSITMKSLTFMLFIALLVWTLHLETCSARRSKHLRQNRVASSASLYKKKGKHHGNNHHSGHSGHAKPNPPSPSPKAAPPPQKAPSSSPPKASGPKTSIPPPKKDYFAPATVFNVVKFGAKGDGASDDTKAFEDAWEAACKVEASTVMVPSGLTFLVGPILFSGPYCQKNIVFQLEGTIIAPTSFNAWKSGPFQWILFSKLVGITVRGSGIINGRGTPWWQDNPYSDPNDDELELMVPLNNTVNETPLTPISSSVSGKMPSMKPTALRFYGSFNVTVTGITIVNSPQCHLKFDNCNGVSVHDMSVSSPGNSPNTDGIHLQNSQNVLIRSVNLACGDDCISIQTGCSNVYIHNVNCGPGHGISIGGLGKDGTKACVSNITVQYVKMHDTMNGVRIKSWQGGSGSVQGVLFSNIQVTDVEFPIVIDQYYCDHAKCKNQTSAVSLSGITFEKVRGTYSVKPVHLACSDSLPCVDVTLTDIQLQPHQERYHLYDPFCWQTFGELISPTVPAIGCLQVGKPPNNKLQTDTGSC